MSDDLSPWDHPEAVAQMMSCFATEADAVRLLRMLTGLGRPCATFGDLRTVDQPTFFRLACVAENEGLRAHLGGLPAL